MQVLWAFKMHEAKVIKESESNAILKDASLVVKTSTVKVVCIKKYCRANEMDYKKIAYL